MPYMKCNGSKEEIEPDFALTSTELWASEAFPNKRLFTGMDTSVDVESRVSSIMSAIGVV